MIELKDSHEDKIWSEQAASPAAELWAKINNQQSQTPAGWCAMHADMMILEYRKRNQRNSGLSENFKPIMIGPQ